MKNSPKSVKYGGSGSHAKQLTVSLCQRYTNESGKNEFGKLADKAI